MRLRLKFQNVDSVAKVKQRAEQAPGPQSPSGGQTRAVSAKVKVLPSGSEFFVGPHETLLEAGLRAGLNLSYDCANGSCGGCKGRVLAGELGTVDFHDYPIPESEKAQGYFLLCRARAGSDLIIEAPEAAGVADVPLQEVTAKVVKLERLMDDLMVVHLRTPRSKTLRFLAGQYVTLEIDGLPPRDKSIASCPCSGRLLQVHFRRRKGDPFPKYVFSRLHTSKKVLLTGPFGEFTLDEASRRPIILLAYETGFASVKSLIEHAIALEMEQPLHLYWVVEKAGGHYMENYCRSWVDSLDSFRYTPLHLDDGKGSLGKRTARAVKPLWTDYEDLSGVDLYMSIPVGAEHPLHERLLDHGLPEDRLRMELLEKY